jgi:drug/metabolite transporter (DMT)-like permease
VLAIAGSTMISWGDFQISGTALYGDLLALIACALITINFMFGQAVRKRLSLVTYTFVTYSISTVVLLTYVLMVGESLFPYPTSD